MEQDILQEQIAYYRARAQEYDESVFNTGRFAHEKELAGAENGLDHLRSETVQHLQALSPFEQILELACGTGIWTSVLLDLGQTITALDAAPEMLEMNRRKCASPRISYQQADLFAWEPEKRYDLVFAGFWLSHVPPDLLDPFLEKLASAVHPGKYLCIADEYAPTPEDQLIARDDIYAIRSLSDKSTYTIVKTFCDLAQLEQKLQQLGFTSVIRKTDDFFFYLIATQRK